jgi:L-seryl-tRNA(Ser) seleniumtransferase
MINSSTRRRFLKGTAACAASGTVLGFPLAAAASRRSGAGVYTSLGVRPVINGVGVVTVLGGSIMPAEVVQAMEEASRYFVPLPELQKKVGGRIAELLKVPAAMVTAGCASAIQVATTACVANGDPQKLARLPDTSGMKNEIIQQKSHESGYEAQMLQVGTRIVWVETSEEAQAAINERTAMMFFLNKADPLGKIRREEWIRIGKERGVPTFNDAASDLPPVDTLWSLVTQGFDLVAFSGGKALLGPQCSGLLIGRQDLIEAALPAISPHDGIGRGMKVGKEEIVGLLAAVERYLKVDHEAEAKLLEERAAYILRAIQGTPGVRAERHVPEIANHVPHVRVELDPARCRLTSKQIAQQLLEGDPPIAVSQEAENGLLISVWMMRGNEHRVVARRLEEILRGAGSA